MRAKLRAIGAATLCAIGCDDGPKSYKPEYPPSLGVQQPTAAPPPAIVAAPAATAPPEPKPEAAPVESLDLLLQAADGNRAVTYAHLKKNADRYAGRAWAFTGRILEISETRKDGVLVTVARISLDPYGAKPMMVIAPFATEFVEGNRVDVAGYLDGPFSYQSQAGWNITIPLLAARSIEKAGEHAKARKLYKRAH